MAVSNLTLKRSKGKGRAKKTRTFSVRLFGYLGANFLWDSGAGDELRPAWIAYLGTEAESQAFTSNFRGGHKAQADRQIFKIPKSAPHRWTTQRVAGGVITTAYLPELFHLEPAFPAPERVQFIFAPPRWWLDQQEESLRATWGQEARDVARAALFAAYLRQRPGFRPFHPPPPSPSSSACCRHRHPGGAVRDVLASGVKDITNRPPVGPTETSTRKEVSDG